MELDELLTRSAPPVTPRDAGLSRDVLEMVALSEAAAASRRRRMVRPFAAGAVSVVAVLGLGGVAAANGVLPSWFPWKTDDGSSCGLQVSVELRTDGAGNAITTRTTAAEQQAAKSAADEYVAGLDLSTIDRQAAAKHWFDYLERVSVGHPSRAQLETEFQGARLETHALSHEVDTRVGNYLTARGYDPKSVMTTVATECDE